MQYSEHNILSQIKNSEDWFIVNLLSMHADLLNQDDALLVKKQILPENDKISDWIEKGYIVDPVAEKKLFQSKYLDFIDTRESDEVQIFFVPWYTCNFSCTYCFQESYGSTPVELREAVVDAFFNWLNQKFSARRKYITLFGGEPLLPGKIKKDIISHFVKRCNSENLELAIVTNGYNLAEYIDVLMQAKIREVQVTLDGPRDMHNQRRILRGGDGSFDHIVKGIDLALEKGITINLRMVVDRENLHTLPELAQFAIAKGWTDNPAFKTQLGRNYELHTCQVGNEKLYSRLELYQEIYQIVQQYPEVLKFHRPAFSISRFLFDEGELPAPLFDACTGTKTEWALDGTGRVYSCTATVGKAGEDLGTFWPQLTEKHDVLTEWQERDVLSISKCTSCNVRLACGGGCAAVAKNQNGKLHTPDCRPIQELLEMGMSVYR